jgi:hypothetical protein
MQVLRIDDPVGLDEARDTILPLAKEPARTPRWTKRRDEFLTGLRELLKSLPKPKVIKPEDFEKIRSEKEDYKREYEKSDEENQTLKKQISELWSHPARNWSITTSFSNLEKCAEISHLWSSPVPIPGRRRVADMYDWHSSTRCCRNCRIVAGRQLCYSI